MKKRDQFLRTIETLCDHWPRERAAATLRAASRYEEEHLPENTGLAALQVVCGVPPVMILSQGQVPR